MSKTMLIDAAHSEETRVVVLAGNELEEFDVETKARQQIRGNIYLAKVTRVEPSLQAGFVDFGNIRHGFLAFSEVHPDYYQIPIADREALLAEEAAMAAEDAVDDEDDNGRARRAQNRRYKIQDVLKRRQIMLVQAVKEERGNKGAALTTYLSLAGRYCVLMPNTPRGGGISRKIANVADRKRLKTIVSDLLVPKGMGLIIRTAGAKANKTEIKRDYEYLIRLWDDIRARTLESVAPSLIHEEESLVKRAIRDLYNKDIGSIVIEGEGAYREAKDFVKMLIPSHARKVHLYKNSTPLFSRMAVDSKLSGIHDGVVQLKSGGYIVINQTEALVAIDVNSGKSTRERSIEQTALKTNLEAADEVARQMRLRDLAGLLVIDFIDMEEQRNDRAVEKRMKDALRLDRARVQMSKISTFGLLEISRQRRRTGVLEGSSHVCPTCSGFGRIRSVSSTATQILREVEAAVGGRRDCEVEVRADTETALYLLNEKRRHLATMEAARGIVVKITAVSEMSLSSYEFEITRQGEEIDEPEFNFAYLKDIEQSDEEIHAEGEEYLDDESEGEEKTDADSISIQRGKRRRPRRRGRKTEQMEDQDNTELSSENGEAETSEEVSADVKPSVNSEERNESSSRRRRRGRRGGRNRRENAEGNIRTVNSEQIETGATENAMQSDAIIADATIAEPAKPAAKSRSRKAKPGADAIEAVEDADTSAVEVEVAKSEVVAKKKPRATKKIKPDGDALIVEAIALTTEPIAQTQETEPKQPRKTGWWTRNASKLFGPTEE
ncbi:MAG: ribonuclease E [Hyphomonadaceae bacterium]|nr:MAG: ribonuclease E [Hyphomonadaceae bacterium]